MPKLFASFKAAFSGLYTLIKRERNAKIHLSAAVLIVLASFYFELKHYELILIIIMIGLVIAAEAINTSIEILADKVEPKLDPEIKKVKDLGAAAVLVLSIAALAVASIIFIPKFIELFQ